MNTFIDTSAFFAMMDLDDRFHRKSKDIFTKLIREKEIFHCSNYIIVETMALIQNRLGFDAVRVFQDSIVPIINIHWVDERIHDIGIKNLLVGNRKKVSLVDYTSFEIIRTLGIEKVFAFDRHFKEQGFRVSGL